MSTKSRVSREVDDHGDLSARADVEAIQAVAERTTFAAAVTFS